MEDFNRKVNRKRIVIIIITILFLLLSCSSVGKTKKKYRHSPKKYKKTSKKYNNPRKNYRPKALDRTIEKYWGVPYKFGGTTRRGFDCSGFMKTIFYEVYRLKLPRSSRQQYSNRAIPKGDIYTGANFQLYPVKHMKHWQN